MFALSRREIIGARTHGDAPDWDGWDAVLIQRTERKAKKMNAPTDYDNVHDEDIGLKKKKVKTLGNNTAECMDTDSVGIFAETVDYIPDVRTFLAEKALRYSHWSKAVEKDRSSTELVLIAQLVGGIVGAAEPRMNWNWLKRILPNEMCSKLKNDVLGSIANFCLSIFDAEDFAKHYRTKNREDNYMHLLRKLQGSEEADSLEKQDKLRMKAMRSIAEGVDVDFEGLTDEEIVFMLQFCLVGPVDELVIQAGLSPRLGSFTSGDSALTLKKMETYIPLKGSCKMQLFLELEREKCYHILDYLFVEACQGFVSVELFKALDKRREGLGIKAMSSLVYDVQETMRAIAGLKCHMLLHSKELATYPLHFGPFGKFADEVIQVIEIADLERRAHGHPFIGVYHILFSLTLSRVGLHHLVQQGFSNSSAEDVPATPPYKIYKLAGEHAVCCGDELVKLEHLVLAVIAVQEGRSNVPEDSENLESLRKSNHQSKTKPWKEVGLSHDSKPIDGWEALAQALKAGIKIPEIRQRDQTFICQ